jgi:hypothetical protein
MIDQRLHTPPLLHLLLQPSLLQRLRDEIITPSIQRTVPIRRQARSRKSNDNNRTPLRRRRLSSSSSTSNTIPVAIHTFTSPSLQPPDLLRRRQPVHHRHPDVHEYQVEFSRFPFVDGFEAVGGRVPADVQLLHLLRDDAGDERVVFGDEDVDWGDCAVELDAGFGAAGFGRFCVFGRLFAWGECVGSDVGWSGG